MIEAQYLPNVEFFTYLFKHEVLRLEAFENFQKQSFRNRCLIRGANQVEMLIVPVKKTGTKMQARDVQIDYKENWEKQHWRSIQSAYGKAPFYPYFADYFRQILFKRHKFLFDLDVDLISVCLRLLELERGIEITEQFMPLTNEVQDGIKDMRGRIHPKRKTVEDGNISFVEYGQVFGRDFVKNLTIIDLLFCEGRNSRQILKEGATGL